MSLTPQTDINDHATSAQYDPLIPAEFRTGADGKNNPYYVDFSDEIDAIYDLADELAGESVSRSVGTMQGAFAAMANAAGADPQVDANAPVEESIRAMSGKLGSASPIEFTVHFFVSGSPIQLPSGIQPKLAIVDPFSDAGVPAGFVDLAFVSGAESPMYLCMLEPGVLYTFLGGGDFYADTALYRIDKIGINISSGVPAQDNYMGFTEEDWDYSWDISSSSRMVGSCVIIPKGSENAANRGIAFHLISTEAN